MTPDIEEHIVVSVAAQRAYEAVANVRRMTRLSPECFAVWVLRRRDGLPTRFVGFNRRGAFVWFTTCRVLIADPGREFTFDVFTFGQPVAQWGYRFNPAGDATTVTEFWVDRRSRAALLLGRVFTGTPATKRPDVNRDGMRRTLQRLKVELEAEPPTAAGS